MHCTKLFEALEKRLMEKKSLDEIGRELCDTVDDPKGKAIRLIKVHKGEEYLAENADWLKYNSPHNPSGKNEPKNFGLNFGQPETPTTNVTPKLGELALMLKVENSLPEGKGISIHGFHCDENNPRYLMIEPCAEKGFHYMILVDFGRGDMEFSKRGFADDFLDFVLKEWTPAGLQWDWITRIIDRLPDNPVWSRAQEVASWKKKPGVKTSFAQ